MDEDVKKEFEKIREEIQNQYQDAIGALSAELAEFKTEMSANLAEMGKMLGDRAKFQDDNISSISAGHGAWSTSLPRRSAPGETMSKSSSATWWSSSTPNMRLRGPEQARSGGP